MTTTTETPGARLSRVLTEQFGLPIDVTIVEVRYHGTGFTPGLYPATPKWIKILRDRGVVDINLQVFTQQHETKTVTLSTAFVLEGTI